MLSVDGQAKHDLKWVGIWAATTLVFPLIAYFTHSAWWMGHLSPAPSCTSMAWRVSGRGVTGSRKPSARTKTTREQSLSTA